MRYPILALTLAIASTLPTSVRAQQNGSCLDSQVAFETETLEKMVRHPEQFIEEGGSVWDNEKPLIYTKAWADAVNVGIPYLKFWRQVGELAELSEEERSQHPLLIMTDSIVSSQETFLEQAIPLVCSFLPEDMDISIPVYFVAFVPPRSFVSGGVVINVSASYWKGDVRNIFNNLTHEIFHVGYSHSRPLRTEPKLENEQLYQMLDALQNEGTATYVGYQANSLFPAPDEVDFRLLENPDEVERLFDEVNELFQEVGEVSEEELQRMSWRTGVTRRGYYIVGAYMAQTIDERLGRDALIGSLTDGPVSFVKLYNSLADEERRVTVPLTQP
jgi:hypothetical protein